MLLSFRIFFYFQGKVSLFCNFFCLSFGKVVRQGNCSITSVVLFSLFLLYNMYVSCHRHFFPVLLLNQRLSSPLRLQASHCSTFRIMCDVPSIAVFCSESIECFHGIVSKFFFKLLVTIPVAPIITGTIVHLRFHIRCISIHNLLYFNFFYYYYYYYYYKPTNVKSSVEVLTA